MRRARRSHAASARVRRSADAERYEGGWGGDQMIGFDPMVEVR